MSKMIVGLAVAVAILGAPVLSFAQSNGPVTRAEVRADLVRVERAGYNPSRGADVNYPDDIQAAESKIAAQDDQQLVANAVGGVAQNGSSASGGASHTAQHSSCVGPASFCKPFFGR